MHVLFALIIFSWTGFTSSAIVNVGKYQRYDQCMEQGQKIADEHPQWDITPKCVPVNE